MAVDWHDVWIGPHVVIQPEAGKIHDGAIEAGAVVTQDVPIRHRHPRIAGMIRYRFRKKSSGNPKAPWWDKDYRDLSAGWMNSNNPWDG